MADSTTTTRQPSPIMRYFEYEHLPEPLQGVSARFGDLARALDAALPDCAEKSAGLRKLLEAKDCMVRAAIPPPKKTEEKQNA